VQPTVWVFQIKFVQIQTKLVVFKDQLNTFAILFEPAELPTAPPCDLLAQRYDSFKAKPNFFATIFKKY
jgi:hypothetical protein